MAQTTSDALSAAITFKVQTLVLKNLRAQLVFADPAYAEKGEFAQGTDALVFVAFPDLAINTTPLTEGTVPTARALTMTTVSVDTAQYGDLVNVSDVAKVKSPKDLAAIASERISYQAAQSIDKISRDAIALGGTPYYHSGVSGLVRSDVASGDKMASAELQRLRAKMFAAKIPMPADGLYKLFVHPFVGYDLRADSTAPGGFMDVNRYQHSEKINSGEIGSMHGFRIIEVNNAPTFSSTTTVYASLAVGAMKGWGAGELQSLRISHIAPGGDHSDPLGQSELFGWKVLFGVSALNNSYYFRMESAATAL